MEKLIIVILAGIAGGFGAEKVSLPGGMLVGSMLTSGIAMIALPGSFTLHSSANTFIQLVLGISLGLTFDSTLIKVAPKVLPLAIVSTVILLSVAFLMAYISYKIGVIDFATALFGFSPGGMTGMSILAQSEGHTASIVAFIHTTRIFTLFLMVPILSRLFSGH
jgi:membrane AbrB-like protein